MSFVPKPVEAVAGVWPQPLVSRPLQVAPSITEAEPGNSPSARFAVYTALVASTTAIPTGLASAAPVGGRVTVAGEAPQPVVSAASQVAPSMTETVLPTKV